MIIIQRHITWINSFVLILTGNPFLYWVTLEGTKFVIFLDIVLSCYLLSGYILKTICLAYLMWVMTG